MARRGVLLLVAVAAVCVAIWQAKLLMAQLDPSASASPVETATAARGIFIVGVTRTGNLESGDVISLRAPAEAGSTLSYVVPDGEPVKKGQLVAKVDTTNYKFDVDRQRLEYQQRMAQVDDVQRNRAQDVDAARLQVDQATRSLELVQKANQTETEKGQTQVGYDQWNVNYAQKDYDKYRDLGKSGVVPVTDVQEKEQQYRSKEFALAKSEKDVSYYDATHSVKAAQAQADINTAKFSQNQANRQVTESVERAKHRMEHIKQRLTDMEKNLSEGELYADRDGVVVLAQTWDEAGRRPVRQGDRVWPRMKLCDVAGLDSLQVPVHVDETSANRLRLGQEAIVRIQGLPGRQYAAKVFSISTVARTIQVTEDPDAIPNQRVFDVVVKLTKPDTKILRPGMRANVQFVFRRLADCVSVPIETVFDRPPKGKFVYVQHGRSFEQRPVKTGERNDEAIVILSGLKAGEHVALIDPTKASLP